MPEVGERTPENYEVYVADRVDVDPDAWADLRFPEPPHTTAYFSAIDSAGLDCSFRYFTLYHGQCLLAAAYGVLVDYPIVGPFSLPVFVGGSPVNLGSPFYFTSAEVVGEALPVLMKAMLAEVAGTRAKY